MFTPTTIITIIPGDEEMDVPTNHTNGCPDAGAGVGERCIHDRPDVCWLCIKPATTKVMIRDGRGAYFLLCDQHAAMPKDQLGVLVHEKLNQKRPTGAAAAPAPQPAPEPALDFGKHAGKTVGQVPSQYLSWLSKGANNVSASWREKAEDELLRRGLDPDAGDGDGATSQATDDPAWRDVPPVLAPDDLAALLQVHRKTILKWHREGRLPPPKSLGSRVLRWRRDVILAWMADPSQP